MDNNAFEGKIRVFPSSILPRTKDIATEMINNLALEDAFFICNTGDIIQKHLEWKKCLPRVKPFYAVKCNDNEHVLRTLAGLGTGFDCASKVEMSKVVGLGVSPSDIIYANPAKPASHIRAAKTFGIATMTFDNETELYKIKHLYPDARLVIRIRCDAENAQCPLGMKFGVSVPEAPHLLAVAKELGLNVVGVSFHVGSGCRDPPVFNRAIASARWIFNAAREFGYNFTLLDIGGGFPGNRGTSIQAIGDVVNASLDDFFPEGCGVDIIAEPGRYYVASAFTLMTQVHSIREVQTESGTNFMYYINDGVYGSFNCILYDHAVVFPETLMESSGELFDCSIWGPTCDGFDQVCQEAILPKLEHGDWLVFNNMGAYTVAAAGTFNGFPVPKVHCVADADTWDVLKKFMGEENFAIENVPRFMKAGVGCNRDAVGWGSDVTPIIDSNNINVVEQLQNNRNRKLSKPQNGVNENGSKYSFGENGNCNGGLFIEFSG